MQIKVLQKNGLEPGWLGASFGLRMCYVRIIITRCTIVFVLTSKIIHTLPVINKTDVQLYNTKIDSLSPSYRDIGLYCFLFVLILFVCISNVFDM